MRIAWIGTGIMGLPMSRRLQSAGFTVQSWHRRKDLPEQLEDGRGDLQRLVADSDVVVSMLPTPTEVESVYLGRRGILYASRPGQMFIDMTTSSPALARHIYELGRGEGVAVLDAPVSGGPIAAANGSLSIMVGGDAAAYEAGHPVFERLGTTVVHQGSAGSGQVAKLLNQSMVAAITAATSEIFSATQSLGLDTQHVAQSLRAGAAGSKLLDFLWTKLEERDATPGFKIAHLRKDLDLSLQMASELTHPMALTEHLRSVVAATEQALGGELGTQLVGLTTADRSGLTHIDALEPNNQVARVATIASEGEAK